MWVKPDAIRLRRDKRSPREDFWHTIRIGALATILIIVLIGSLVG